MLQVAFPLHAMSCQPTITFHTSIWEGSHEDGAKVFNRETGQAYDWDKVHKVTFKGKYHNSEAWGPSHASPQRTPVIFQAGGSKAGSEFAGKHGEALFIGGKKPATAAPGVQKIRDIAKAHGRDPDHLKFFPQITPFIGRTLEEAQEKYRKALANADYRGGLTKLSNYLGINLAEFPLNEPFKMDDQKIDGIQTMINIFKRDPTKVWTPRSMGQQMAFMGFAQCAVGTPEMIADVIEEWAEEGSIDGFNVACMLLRDSLHSFRNVALTLSFTDVSNSTSLEGTWPFVFIQDTF